MFTVAEELLRAEELAEQLLAKEVKEKGKQQSTLHIAKLLEGEDVSIDLDGMLGGMLPASADQALTQQMAEAKVKESEAGQTVGRPASSNTQRRHCKGISRKGRDVS